MIRTYLFAAVAAITLSSCGGNKVTVNDETITLEDGIYAKLETTMGDILIDFHEDLVPMTAANFIALAEGNHPEERMPPNKRKKRTDAEAKIARKCKPR